MLHIQTRRRFLQSAVLAGSVGLAGWPRYLEAEPSTEPPPETTTVRFSKLFRSVCLAPKNVAGELLRAEGFTDVRYLEMSGEVDAYPMLSNGELDFEQDFAPPNIAAIDAGQNIKLLAGVHSGCLELIANEGVRNIEDLRGKKVGVFSMNSAPHVLVTLMASYVGLDPASEIMWVENPTAGPMQLFIEGKIDAFLALPPEPQELRARGLGHTILNINVDAPWSQHYCCLLAASADFVEKYPIATKRVLRAILKTADICASNPELAARLSVDGKFTDQYDFALEGLRQIRYDRWREFDPEDTLRFYALRMHEVGFIKHGPNEIIARGTDWRFLDEIKRTLKT